MTDEDEKFLKSVVKARADELWNVAFYSKGMYYKDRDKLMEEYADIGALYERVFGEEMS